jgi:hypothetical protein
MNMKSVAIAFAVALLAFATTLRAEITGDYVEARSASVFTGACHFNGEVVTTGRDAIVAWNIKQGTFDQVDLAGVRAVAVVSSDQNLSERDAVRKTELVIDESASQQQAEALVAMLNAKSSASIGSIVAVKRAPIRISQENGRSIVTAGDIAKLDIQAMPDGECCKQPNNVWYTPLVTLSDQKVGYTTAASYVGGAAGAAWERGDENSAFYGKFTL